MRLAVPSALLAVMGLSACGVSVEAPGSGAGGSDTADASSSDASGSLSSSSSSGASPLEACRGGGLYQSADCQTAVRAQCLQHLTAEACGSAEPFQVDADAFTEISCTWADVVTVADVDSCSIASVFGRCEAVSMMDGASCAGGNACGATPGATWRVLPISPKELVRTTCVPLGYWIDVTHARGPDEGSCLDNVQPPAPELCTCAEAACGSLEQGA